MGYPTLDFIFLSEEDMIKSGVKNMPDCIDVMEEALGTEAVKHFCLCNAALTCLPNFCHKFDADWILPEFTIRLSNCV